MRAPYLYRPEGTPFETIIDGVIWQDPTQREGLVIVKKYPDFGGWLGTTGDDGRLNGLIGFSVEAVELDDITPPKDIKDVKRRLGPVEVGLFNTDMTAKGLGSTVANSPQALQPHTITEDGIAVRQIPFTRDTEVFISSPSESMVSRRLRLLRHGALLVASAATDKVTRSTTGTEQAMHFMDRNYGDAPLVQMPIPPIWQEQQSRAGVTQPVQPYCMLVRGGQYAGQNLMTRVGTFPVSR